LPNQRARTRARLADFLEGQRQVGGEEPRRVIVKTVSLLPTTNGETDQSLDDGTGRDEFSADDGIP
jgi:hypothetical protein